MDKVSDFRMKPSWVDLLLNWIDDLPGPSWLFYGLITVGTILLNNAIFWIDGGLPPGTFDQQTSIFGLYTVYWLGLYHYLSKFSSKSLHRFRPLLDVDESGLGEIERQLTYLPHKAGLWIIPLGIISTFINVSGDITYLVGQVAETQNTILPVIYYSVLTLFLSTTFFALFLRTVRQLRWVDRLHEQATHIDLLDLEAPHAFSGLTSRTGIGMILLLTLISLQGQGAGTILPLEVIFYLSIALLAVVVFVVPLEGMHRRLHDEKTRQLGRINELLRTASERFHIKLSNDDYDHMDQSKDAIQTLMLERDLIEKTPTWPWEPRTVRGFATSLLLPVFLLLITRLIERAF